MAVQVPVQFQMKRRRFTVDEYYRMSEAGILGAAERVELVAGDIVEMSPIGPRHGGTVLRVNWLFGQRFGDVALTNIQNALRLDAHSEPQPDAVLLRPRPDFYTLSHPTPADVLLVVEVADSSIETDRRVKLPSYARVGIPESWLVDLVQDEVLVHRDPGPTGYRAVRTLQRGDKLAPLAFPGRELAVTDILG